MPLAAIISKPQKAELGTILPELRAWLAERGWSCILDLESAAYLRGVGGVARAEMAEQKPELAVVLGGDGRCWRRRGRLRTPDVPLLSVNLGSLGFLTEVPLAELYATLQAWCEGTAAIEVRSMLHAELCREGKVLHASGMR